MQQDSSINQTQKQVSEQSLCNRRIHTYIYIKKTVTKIEKTEKLEMGFSGFMFKLPRLAMREEVKLMSARTKETS
jgi:hypothetical protein